MMTNFEQGRSRVPVHHARLAERFRIPSISAEVPPKLTFSTVNQLLAGGNCATLARSQHPHSVHQRKLFAIKMLFHAYPESMRFS